MASAVDYVNRALARLAADPIAALTPEDSPTAAIAASLFQPAVDELLADFPWRFATTRVQLARVAEDLPGGSPWSFQYAVPPGTLRIVRTDREPSRWELYAAPGEVAGGGMQQRLYTHRPVVWIDVVRRIDAALFPPHFQKALVSRLAAELALPITRRADMSAVLRQQAEEDLSSAKVHDWNQQPWPELDDGNVIADARYG